MSTIFGGNTGLTYEQVKQRRRIADRLRLENSSRAPRNIGEGLHAISKALVARGSSRQAENRMKELDAEWKDQVSGMGLDPTRAAIFSRMPYEQRDMALLQWQNQQDAERRAAARSGAAAANRASKEAEAERQRQAITQALMPKVQQREGVQMGPTVEAANAGAQSGGDLGFLQTEMQQRTPREVVAAMLAGGVDPKTAISLAGDFASLEPEKPKMPASVQEYEYARNQGYEGSYQDFMTMDEKAALGPVAPQLVGTEGQALKYDPQSGAWNMVVLPGSKLDIQQKELAEKTEKADEIKEVSADVVTDEIARARELIADQSWLSPATGFSGGLIAALPMMESTRAGALGERLSTIKANIGFDKLQSMRDASPTGGALGQVSEFENRLLQAVYGSLVQSQSAKDITYNLDRVEKIYQRVIHEGIPDDEARKLIDEIEMSGFRGKPKAETADGLANFSEMNDTDLTTFDLGSVPPEQWDAWEAEMKKRGM